MPGLDRVIPLWAGTTMRSGVGVPYDESALFEALTLGVFEAGLSWSIVFGKRDAFYRAFHGFEIARVAAMTERDVDRLVQDPSIIRNRAKIRATVENARAMSSASPSLAALARSYESTRKRAPRSIADLPTSTPQADAFAKQLKHRATVSWGHECVRAHAERRRGQRPHPRLLPGHRLHPTSKQGLRPGTIGIRRSPCEALPPNHGSTRDGGRSEWAISHSPIRSARPRGACIAA